MSVPLPRSRDERQALSTEMADMATTEAFQAVMDRVSTQLQMALSDMEQSDNLVLVYRAQGKYSAYKRVLGMVTEIRRELREDVNPPAELLAEK